MTLHDSFKYKKDLDNPAVLGCLEGPCADIQIPTRNGRKYSERLWDKVFKDDIVKEAFENGGLFGEAQHPIDREETDVEKIAIAMKEPPVKGKDGKLYGRFYILDTPCGRIMKTLCDFGYKWGISSRGSGDVYDDYDGNESVDEDTYHFETFDAVLLPAVKSARLTPVTESLQRTNLRKALNESLSTSDDDGKRIMSELLEELNISLKDEDKAEETVAESSDAEPKTNEADNDGEEVIKELQEALSKNETLEKRVAELQEKLSVSYAKEIRMATSVSALNEQLSKFKDNEQENRSLETEVKRLTETLQNRNSIVERKQDVLKSVRQQLEKSEQENTNLKKQVKELQEQCNKSKARVTVLTEKLSNKSDESQILTENLKREVETLKDEAEKTSAHFKSKLNKSESAANKYKKLAEGVISSYISLRASQLGIRESEIRNRLTEDITVDEIESVCESLQVRNKNMNSLPFIFNESAPRMKVKDNSASLEPQNPDDVVDADLFNL